MQLMLLEQQNKKRLLMAREEMARGEVVQEPEEPPEESPDAPVETPIPKIGPAWPDVSATPKAAVKRKRKSTGDGCGDDHPFPTPEQAACAALPMPMGTLNTVS